MESQLICIGDELLLGDTLNTHAAWLGEQLARAGAPLSKVYTIGDDMEAIQQMLRHAMDQAQLVITTGGLGPTHDDITKEAVTQLFDAPLVLHRPTLDFIKKRFKKKNIPFSRSNYHQAEVPQNCEVLFNTRGTAPGLWFEEKNTRLAVLPGIGHEMRTLMQQKVLPRIEKVTRAEPKLFSTYIQTAGIGESTLSDEVIGPLDHFLSDAVSIAYLPSPKGNTMRISTKAPSQAQADEVSHALVQHIYAKAEKYIIGEGKDYTLNKVIGKFLEKSRLTIAVAESCTGGALANAITDIPGSSAYMLGGIVAYSNLVKQNHLDVSQEKLQEFGAVSKPVALQMAQGVAQKMGADIGLSTTGVVGPGGGTREKPVGTVWIGFWSKDRHFCLKAFFTNDRLINKERAVAVALETARRSLLNIEPMPYGLKPHYV